MVGNFRQSQEAAPRINRRHLAVYMTIFIASPILTFITGRWLDNTFSLPRFPPLPFNLIIGFIVFFPGLAVGIKSTRLLFKVGKGLPWGEFGEQYQTKRLVTSGPYAYCRNPMTVGYSLLPCGMGIMFRSIGMAIFVPAIIFLASVAWLRIREEPSLERRFGEAYREYKQKTPFLVPRLRPLISDLISNLIRLLQPPEGKRAFSSTWLPVTTVGFSLAGLLIFIMLTFSRSIVERNAPAPLIGGIFVVICVMGIVAGVLPSRCSSLLHHRKRQVNKSEVPRNASHQGRAIAFQGHHPSCGNFTAHVIDIGNKFYCAGCTGLIIGAVISIIGSLLYFLVGLGVGGLGPFFFWTGCTGVILGLLQYNLSEDRSFIHLFLNVIFVLGSFLLLVGVTEMKASLFLDMYLLGLILYWILSRILLSQWEHRKTCASCEMKICGL